MINPRNRMPPTRAHTLPSAFGISPSDTSTTNMTDRPTTTSSIYAIKSLFFPFNSSTTLDESGSENTQP